MPLEFRVFRDPDIIKISYIGVTIDTCVYTHIYTHVAIDVFPRAGEKKPHPFPCYVASRTPRRDSHFQNDMRPLGSTSDDYKTMILFACY